MAAGSKILAAVFVSLKRNIIDDIISPERARLLTVGVVCINREYEFLEDDELDNCEDIIDFAEEHQMKKIIRSKSIARQKNICSKRYKKIANRTCIPSIYVGFFWNSDGTELLNKPYISYGKNSRLQQCLKRATNKKIRQIKHCNLPVKGNYYRKIFDYWWTWI